jgi:hypothetical protein
MESREKKCPPRRSKEMDLPNLKHSSELLKRQNVITIETMGKRGRGILKEPMDEHIKHFPWPTRNTMDHYTSTYLEQDTLPMMIDIHHQTVVSWITKETIDVS